jgi:transcriptional regulator with XRE-family HTH domain
MKAGQPSRSSNRRGGDDVFAAWFRHIATEAGFTGRGWQRRLSELADVSEQQIGRYANGASIPSPEKCHQLAEALNIDLSVLLVKAGHMTPAAAARHPTQPRSPGTRITSPALKRIADYLNDPQTDAGTKRNIEQTLAGIAALIPKDESTTDAAG